MVKIQRWDFGKSRLSFFLFQKRQVFEYLWKNNTFRIISFAPEQCQPSGGWHWFPTPCCPADTCWEPGAATGMDPLLLVLSISKGAKRIPSHASVSSKDIEILILSKEQLSSIMVGSRFFYFKDYPKWKQGESNCLLHKHEAKGRAMSCQCCSWQMEAATDWFWHKFLHIHVTEFFLGFADFLTLNSFNIFSRLQKHQIV